LEEEQRSGWSEWKSRPTSKPTMLGAREAQNDLKTNYSLVVLKLAAIQTLGAQIN